MIGEPKLTRLDYEASEGKEIFLSYEDANETLFGLLRLRINCGFPAAPNADSAFIRELHVFGSEVPLGEKREQAAQHRGLGAELLREAERIASEEFHITRLYVLSGVGARDYYRSFGYHLAGAYMVKELHAWIA